MSARWLVLIMVIVAGALAAIAILIVQRSRAPVDPDAVPALLLPAPGNEWRHPLSAPEPPPGMVSIWGDPRWWHDDQIFAIAFDGDDLVTGGNENVVRRWGRDGRLVSASERHFQIHILEPGPDGTLVVAGADRRALVLDARTWRRIHSLDGHHTIGKTGARHPVMPLLAIDGEVGQTYLWDIATGYRLAVVDEPAGHADGHAFLPDGPQGPRALLAAEPPAVVDGRTGAVLATLDPLPGRTDAVAVSPNGRHAVIAGGRTLRRIDPESCATLAEIDLDDEAGENDAAIESLAVADDGTVIAASDGLWRWATDGARPARICERRGEGVEMLRVAPDGSRVAVAWRSRERVDWFSLPGGAELDRIEGDVRSLRCLARSPDGQLVATGGSAITLWDATTGARLRTFGTTEGKFAAIAFLPDSRHVVAGDWFGTLALWEIDGREIGRTRMSGGIRALACGAEGILVTTPNDLSLRDAATLTQRWSRDNHDSGCAWCAAGVVAHARDAIEILDPRDGSLRRRMPWAEDAGRWTGHAAVLADGTLLLDRGDLFWLDRSGRPVRRLGTWGPWSVAPDGRRVAIAARDCLLLVDALAGRIVAGRRTGPVNGIAWSGDGRRILLAGGGTVQAWDAQALEAAGVATTMLPALVP